MARSLVIVESPAKARTIGPYLGPDYRVESSIGHIRDLPRSAADVPEKYRGKRWARLGVDVEGGLVHPALDQHELVGVHHAAEHLELLASRLLHDFLAASPIPLGELGALPFHSADGNDESNGNADSSPQAA